MPLVRPNLWLFPHGLRCLPALVLGTLVAFGCSEEPDAPPSSGPADVVADTGFVQFGDTAAKPDTTPVDTGKQDVAGKPDTAVLDVAVADGTANDVLVVDTTASDAVATTDAGKDTVATDATGDTSKDGTGTGSDSSAGCQFSSDCTDNNPCTTDSCIAGKCVFAGNGLCCQTGADCDDGNACTTDSCTSAGCLYAKKTCNDGLPCTVDACNAADGQCKHSVIVGQCAIDGQCMPSGTAGTNACLACVPELDPVGWSPLVGKACSDGSACTSADSCSAQGTCVGVAKAGCCSADSDCTVAGSCLTSTCDVPSGTCQFSAKPDCCTSGSCCQTLTGTIAPAGTGCGSVAVATEVVCNGAAIQTRTATAGCDGLSATGCQSASSNLVWSGWTTLQTCGGSSKCLQQPGSAPQCVPIGSTDCAANSGCNDNNGCTDDLCVGGKCANLQKPCAAGDSCQQATCDAKTGTCGLAVVPGSCRIDSACYGAGVKQPQDPCKVCDPSQSTTGWSVAAACKCTTTDSCCGTGGVAEPAYKSCGGQVIATEYACDPGGTVVQKRTATAGCSGAGAVCSDSFVSWGPWKNVEACTSGTACQVSDKTLPGSCVGGADPICSLPDSYEVGANFGTAADLGSQNDSDKAKLISPDIVLGSATDSDIVRYTIADAVNNLRPAVDLTWQAGAGPIEICAYVACLQGAGGKDCAALTCPAGTTPKTQPDVSGASVNGCCATGSTGDLQFVPDVAGGDRSAVVWLQVTNQANKCQKVSLNLTFGSALVSACTPGTACCTSGGSWAPAGSACGADVLASEYQCSGTAPGNLIQRRDAKAGCSGSGASCSADPANWVWGPWVTQQPCSATEACAVPDKTKPGTCTQTQDCAPGSSCCTASGSWAAAGTFCGKKALDTEYQCKGADIEVRKRFATCGGGSAQCSPLPGSWSEWTVVSACASGTTCTPANAVSVLPSCAAPSDPCLLADPWENGDDLTINYPYGDFDDGDKAQWVAPAVRLSGAQDKDYFVHTIEDQTSIDFSDPRVYVEWKAAEPVTVCAYYRCWDGLGGEDCYEIDCPAGTEAFSNSFVSSVSGNGCCKTAANGVIDFEPDAPLSLDESGEAFWSVKATTAVCQTVSVKLAFGDDTGTACDPVSTCCTAEGKVASAGTPCGNTVTTQYTCGDDGIEQRKGRGTCNANAKCQTGAKNLSYDAFALSEPCLATETCMVGASGTPGQCQVVTPAGSCNEACGGASKSGECYCDAFCITAGDCCADYSESCGGTCSAACGGLASLGSCWCDADCTTFGDCCLDKASACP